MFLLLGTDSRGCVCIWVHEVRDSPCLEKMKALFYKVCVSLCSLTLLGTLAGSESQAEAAVRVDLTLDSGERFRIEYERGKPAAGVLTNWRPGRAKQHILTFVDQVTDPASPYYIPRKDRIAVFDHDGTLWCEKPVYPQTVFVFDRLRSLAWEHERLREKQPYKAAIERDWDYFGRLPWKKKREILLEAHEGLTDVEYVWEADLFLETALHPRFKRVYTDLAYAPMLQLLDYLNSKAFTIYIVTGGGRDFVRAFSGPVYGISEERVIGTSVVYEYRRHNNRPVLVRTTRLVEPFNLGGGKAVQIQRQIGKRPVLAVGNSSGDLEMLQYADNGTDLSLCVIIRHDDAVREYAYDKGAERILKEAENSYWTVVSMRDDFERVFAFEGGNPE